MALPIPRRNDVPAPAARPIGWDPLGELHQLNRQLAGYLDVIRQGIGVPDGLSPPVDVEETDDVYLVDIELPGIAKEDLDIEIAGQRLTIRGERKDKERVGILRRRERIVGRFQYEVTLPGAVDDAGVTAHIDHGVLTVQIPKPVSERPRRIQIR